MEDSEGDDSGSKGEVGGEDGRWREWAGTVMESLLVNGVGMRGSTKKKHTYIHTYIKCLSR